MLFKLMPGLYRLSHYDRSYLHKDIVAGLIVAILFIPQSMAYATIAGVPLVVGLYAATVPLIIYALFGSCKYLSVGPVSIVSLLAYSGVSSIASPHSPSFIELILLLGLLVGAIHLLLGILRTGFLFDFISQAVITGFTSAAAIIIALNQVKSLVGISLPPYEDAVSYLVLLASHLSQANLDTLVIGLSSLCFLLLLKKVAPAIGPLLVISSSILLVSQLALDQRGVDVVGAIPSGLPKLIITFPTMETVLMLLPIATTIAFISFLESYAVAKTVAKKEKEVIQTNQELIGLGLANLSSSFIGSIPVAGALSRTAVNYQSGARTNLALLITALFIIITLLFLTPLFYYLPKATLAAVIILAVSKLVHLSHVPKLMRSSPLDALILLSTFLATLMIDIFLGLLIGIGLSMFVALVKKLLFPYKKRNPL
ncbi:SulP family inorganic anion transporter [Halalkalibacter alkaliphilus]|uniref:SulP family inorganic anion transporter n=1 Tax=Halalkalibacter alkaliphilus TaxID=2917993 RepID=A0A9X2I6U7_9BACI|nr:SulP family inorganic anion transporter [Halalkalibacter alkaliphilus]MCL7747969.1 SulP family inorganic anion transporter [Halalkalibacter alkaliphilus]